MCSDESQGNGDNNPTSPAVLELKERLVILDKQNTDLRVKVRKLHQVVEAFGDTNRWFAAKEIGRPVTEKEALEHYLENGGAEHYAMVLSLRKAERRHRERIQAMQANTPSEVVKKIQPLKNV